MVAKLQPGTGYGCTTGKMVRCLLGYFFIKVFLQFIETEFTFQASDYLKHAIRFQKFQCHILNLFKSILFNFFSQSENNAVV